MAIAFALLASADPITIQQFTLALRELSISPEACQGGKAAISLLSHRKFDAVIVDLQLREQAGVIMDEVRLSASNRTAVTFAIGGDNVENTASFRRRTSFVFDRPVSAQSIRSTLKPAYGMILREQRRYFRHPASIPVTVLIKNMPEVRCHSMNISEGGMALSTVVPLSLGEEAQLQFILPGHEIPFSVKSAVCWLKSGHLGVRFVSLSSEHKSELQGWLSRKLEEGLPEFVAQQFQKASS
jgi:c-di-GMP-binding flagellar brake protein YcgR